MIRALIIAVVSAGLGLLAIFYIGGDLDWHALAALDAKTLFISFGLLLANYLLGGLRLRWLSSLAGGKIRFYQGVRAYLLGLIGAAITPGGSGNAPAVGLSLRKTSLSSAQAWSVTLYTSILDLFFFAWSVPLSLVILGSRTRFLSGGAVGMALAVSLVFLGLWYVFAYRLVWLRRTVGWLFRQRFFRRWQDRAEGFFESLTEGTALITRQPLWVQVPLAGLTAAQHISNYLIFFVITSALRTTPLWSSLAVVHLSTILTYVTPTPGGSGFLEVAVTSLLGSRVAPAVITWRLISFYSRFLLAPFIGGALIASYRRKPKEDPVPS